LSFRDLPKRRGLRAIVTRETIPDRRCKLTLECGHVVVRHVHGQTEAATQAVCPTCKRADAKARDEAYK